MSRSLSARRLHRTLFSLPPSTSQHPPSGSRQLAYAALKTRPEHDRRPSRRQEHPPAYSRAIPHEPGTALHHYSQQRADQDLPLDDTGTLPIYEEQVEKTERRVSRERERTRTGTPPPSPAKPDEVFAGHLDGLFSPLKFPLELAARVLTHASHPAAYHGHNAQFSFIGRRVLESYLLLLLSSSPQLKPSHDLQEIVSRVLNTYFLGQHVGSKWGLGRVMRWTPTIAASMLLDESRADKTKLLKDVGLYKVQGDAVTAVMGGIFQQFGASTAHRIFHSRLLPRLLTPHGGLPLCFHADALEASRRLGGVHGDLVVDSPEQKLEALPSPTLNRQQLRH
ncbi:ribonuclease-III-like-domain-containing protein [Roridomyces roridus]|uniref:Ribonuclease-III-like-domain-containing protein n=1 Tax=Roridomyces roridus TaxID=1738132 RepID=A0AAD7C2I1_9AGAR|nr:ribonuclease-III-like-domain-containing protein [Roridomyces roridus]